MTFLEYLENINSFGTVEESKVYISKNFFDIQYSYYSSSFENLESQTLQINEIFLDILEKGTLSEPCILTNAFIELLADYFELFKCVGSLRQIENKIDENSNLKKRIKASQLFLRVNDATTEYLSRFDEIIGLLKEAQEDGDISYKSTITFINYYYTSVSSFIRLNRNDLLAEFVSKINNIKSKYAFLTESIIEQLLQIPYANFRFDFTVFYNNISIFIKSKLEKGVYSDDLSPEISDYTAKLNEIEEKNFVNIRNLSVTYLMNLSSTKKNLLKDRLDNGLKIIDDVDLLYAYFFSFGKMHYSKVYEGINKLKQEIEGRNVALFDWGCGQALASMVFFEFIQKNKLKVNVDNLTLIEPSELALKRGIAHINCIYPQIKNSIKPICKGLDSVDNKDLINNSQIKLHLFSNIIDVPFFDLNRLCHKIKELKGENLFLCVSPVLSETGRKIRLRKFSDFFAENFETKNISETINTKKENKWKSNNCPCVNSKSNHTNDSHICYNAWTRHEIIFKTIIT